MLRVAIIGYTILHGFFYSCSDCMANSSYWMPYYIIDEIVGGGVILWWLAFKHTKKHKVPAFALFVFSVIRGLWNLCCWVMSINASDTKWTMFLFFALMPVIYYTLFSPDGVLTVFLDKHLKRLNL